MTLLLVVAHTVPHNMLVRHQSLTKPPHIATGAQRLAAHVLDILEAFQEPAVAPTPCSTPVSSLAVAQSAHKLLLQQAVLLRGKLTPSPVDSSTPDACTTSGTSRQSSSSGNKARELACFLQSHVNRMQGLLHTLPGGGNASAGQAAAAAATTLQACPATASSAVRPRTASPVCRSALPHTQRPGSALVAPSYTSSPAGACLSAATTAGASDIMHQQQQQQPYQLTASAPDLRPYLHFPPRRPGSAAPCTGVSAHHRQQQQHDASPASSADAESNALHVQELQCALATRDALLMQQRQECSELQEQLQAAVQELGAVQEQWRASEAAVNTLHAQAADAAQTNSTLATQLAAAEQQLQQCRQQCSELRLQVQQLQDNSHDVGHQGQHAEQLQAERLASAVLTGQISQLQAVLAEAEVQVQELQRQLHTQQVQHIQAQAELMEQLEAAVEAATRAQQQSSASVEAGGSLSDPGGVGRCSGNTEALVCEVAQTSVAVAQCMDDLQEVVASTRRVTAMGLLGAPQLVKRFSQLDVEWEKKGDGYLASAAGRRTGDSD